MQQLNGDRASGDALTSQHNKRAARRGKQPPDTIETKPWLFLCLACYSFKPS